MEPYKQIKMLHSVYSLFLLFFFEIQAFVISGLLIVTSTISLNETFTYTDHNFASISTQAVSQTMNFFYDFL